MWLRKRLAEPRGHGKNVLEEHESVHEHGFHEIPQNPSHGPIIPKPAGAHTAARVAAWVDLAPTHPRTRMAPRYNRVQSMTTLNSLIASTPTIPVRAGR